MSGRPMYRDSLSLKELNLSRVLRLDEDENGDPLKSQNNIDCILRQFLDRRPDLVLIICSISNSKEKGGGNRLRVRGSRVGNPFSQPFFRLEAPL